MGERIDGRMDGGMDRGLDRRMDGGEGGWWIKG